MTMHHQYPFKGTYRPGKDGGVRNCRVSSETKLTNNLEEVVEVSIHEFEHNDFVYRQNSEITLVLSSQEAMKLAAEIMGMCRQKVDAKDLVAALMKGSPH